MDDLSYEQARSWLIERCGVQVTLSIGDPSGSTGASVRGVLAIDEDAEVVVFDAQRGPVDAFRVGDVRIQMLEGDFVTAELVDWDEPEHGVMLMLEFGEIQLTFSGGR